MVGAKSSSQKGKLAAVVVEGMFWSVSPRSNWEVLRSSPAAPAPPSPNRGSPCGFGGGGGLRELVLVVPPLPSPIDGSAVACDPKLHRRPAPLRSAIGLHPRAIALLVRAHMAQHNWSKWNGGRVLRPRLWGHREAAQRMGAGMEELLVW
jgi:hypothetical protein